MSRISSVKKLPAPVLAQLHARLRETHCSDFDAHYAWLCQQGYAVSRSALHRYAAANQAAILQAPPPADGPSEVEARLRCLEIATRLDGGERLTTLTHSAEVLLQWVYGR